MPFPYVVGQFDLDREPLDDLDEVASGVLGFSAAAEAFLPYFLTVNPVIRPSTSWRLPYMSTVASYELARGFAGLPTAFLLEVRVDPNLLKRADSHQGVPGVKSIAGVRRSSPVTDARRSCSTMSQ